MKRSAAIEHDQDFEVLAQVTKHWTDPATGRRFLRGTCTGVAEDADGERVSARAIAKMAATPLAGGAVKATASHEQDWLSEFGDVVALKHDPDHDELNVDVALPRQGDDPIADKAFREAQKGRLGWSIGGKLNKSYFELVPGEVGKGGEPRRRHVLDDIALRHVMLTKKPSYRQSFAQAVAKTAGSPTAPADDTFFDEPDDQEQLDAAAILTKAREDLEATIRKAKTDPKVEDLDDKDATPDAAEADAPAADAAPADAGVADAEAGDTTPGGDTEVNEDAAAAAKLPKGDGARHLSCPNCGAEFAAPLPDDVADDSTQTPVEKPDDEKPSATTAKTTTKETLMRTPLNDTLASLRALAEGGQEDVTKTDPTDAEKPDPTDGAELTDVEKMIGASHLATNQALEAMGADVAKGFNDLLEVVKKQGEQLAELGTGRRSVAKARRGGDGEPKPQRADADGDVDVAKIAGENFGGLLELPREQLQGMSSDELAKHAPDGVSLMKVINYRDRGIK